MIADEHPTQQDLELIVDSFLENCNEAVKAKIGRGEYVAMPEIFDLIWGPGVHKILIQMILNKLGQS